MKFVTEIIPIVKEVTTQTVKEKIKHAIIY